MRNEFPDGSTPVEPVPSPGFSGEATVVDQTSPVTTEKFPAPPTSAPAVAMSGGAPDPERWVEQHGDYLFRYAMSRLRDTVKAEDAVQETFLAALKGAKNFAGRSAEKSWLTGILKNKIYDHYRKAGRETAFTDLEFYADEESDRFMQDGFFKDGWNHELGPQEWNNPGASLDSDLFWKTFHDCSSKLPRKVATVFHLREVDGIASREICSLLNISENNLWVMLHRARMALRRCLETNWFAHEDRTP